MSTTYAIGDLHGRYDVMKACLDHITRHNAQDKTVVFLGDYIDRGPDSRLVIERLMMGPQDGSRWVVLMGNHEAMCLQAHTPTGDKPWWLGHGGAETLESYDGEIPQEHLDWIAALPSRYEDKHRIFVHAGVKADAPYRDNTDDTVMWIRHARFTETAMADDPRMVVHGHTAFQNGPVVLKTRVNLDVKAYRTGTMSVAVFDDDIAGPPTQFLNARVGFRSGYY